MILQRRQNSCGTLEFFETGTSGQLQLQFTNKSRVLSAHWWKVTSSGIDDITEEVKYIANTGMFVVVLNASAASTTAEYHVQADTCLISLQLGQCSLLQLKNEPPSMTPCMSVLFKT